MLCPLYLKGKIYKIHPNKKTTEKYLYRNNSHRLHTMFHVEQYNNKKDQLTVDPFY